MIKRKFEKVSRGLRYSFIETPTDKELEGLRSLAMRISQESWLSPAEALSRMSSLAKCGDSIETVKRHGEAMTKQAGKD